GDVTQISSLSKAFENQDLIIHAAGSIEYDPAKRLQMETINVGGTKNVIASIQKGQKLLHVSSVVAIGASTEPAVLTE
ncbi:SDR family oxidoreductase, partial [Escherichia coli]|uniref:SDR family oxidoreductase n=1 Tax=Escherichia coli TaxID=562 RepID=UPI0028DF0E7A